MHEIGKNMGESPTNCCNRLFARTMDQANFAVPEPTLAAEAVLKVLRPLSRLAIDHGLQLPAMVDLLKKAMVEEAVQTTALGVKKEKRKFGYPHFTINGRAS